VVLNVAATAPLILVRRGLAVAAVLVSAAIAALLSTLGWPLVTGFLGYLVVVFLVTARYGRPAAGLTLLVVAGNAIYPYAGDEARRPLALLLLCAGLVAAALGDAWRRQQRAIVERDEARLEIAEVRRDQAALAERSRIARELHDVVAHHVSMMVIRAETARVSVPGLPEAAADGLTAIRDTGREALAEMRRLVAVLREAPDEPADRQPQPGLHDLDELVAAAREAGNDVRLRREGTPYPVPAGVQLCAYRIAQEALTNVRRHAPGAPADVVLRYGASGLHLGVHDRGPGSRPTTVDGHGMLGMRERAALVGGSLRAGSSPDGFAVEADLPVPIPSSRGTA
jgi:signal transduction histidine kinase